MSQDRFRFLEFEQTAPPAEAAEVGRDQHHHLSEANLAYLEGDFEPALRHYSTVLKYDKAMHEAWAGQVRCLVKLGELREARTWSEKACGLFPNIPILESARGLALTAGGLTADGLVASDMALESAEKAGLADANLWLERGSNLLADKKLKTAEMCFLKALELSPDDPDWAQRVAAEWLAGSEPARALALLNQVVAKRPSRGYGWLLQAQALRRLGQREPASAALKRAEDLRPHWKATEEERRLLRRGCWIATLVFAHEEHPVVRTLRAWRDRRWMSHPVGRSLSALYESSAPHLCQLLAGRPTLQNLLRSALTALAGKVKGV